MSNSARIYCILVIICMVASCSRVPKTILSERKMRVTIYDMLIAEAMIESNVGAYQTDADKQMVYDAVFAKHRITQAAYDSALIWYGKNMDLYLRIYNLVLKDVNAALSKLDEIKPDLIAEDLSDKDSVNIWKYPRSKVFKPNRLFNSFLFDIKPQKPFSPGSYYRFNVSVWGIPPDLQHKLIVHIHAVQADTIISVRQAITGDGQHEAMLQSAAGKDVLRIYGYLMMNDTVAYHQPVYLNDIRLMKFNERLAEIQNK